MSTEEPKIEAEANSPLTDRLDIVSANIRGLFEAAIKIIEKGDKADPAAMLAPALSLLESAMYSINEIADAQQRLVGLAEAEYAEAAEFRDKMKAEHDARNEEKSNRKRRFIGQQD